MASTGQVSPRPGQGPDARNWVIEKDPAISITAAAEENAIKAGSELWVDVALKNISSQDLTVLTGGAGPTAEYYYRIEVLDEKGAAAPFTKRGDLDLVKRSWRIKVYYQTLKPGEALRDKERLFISEWWDVSQPGKYSIVVQRFDGASRQVVRASPVTVTVTD